MQSVLVTGVGGGVGQSIIKSLHDTGYRVIGADADRHAAGLYAVARGYHIPFAIAHDYIHSLLSICRREGCRVLFPGLDAELPFLAAAAGRFAAVGCHVIVSQPEVVSICDDKLATSEFLARHGFHAPATSVLGPGAAKDMALPLVLKPRRGGRRSRGVFVVHTREDLDDKLTAMAAEDYVVQEYIDGDEYTCGTISADGACHGVIVMRRVLRDGDTHKAFVVRDAALEGYVRRVVDALHPTGPCNVQLRVRQGRPYVFEFNARCSGTTHGRALAGFNEPVMAIRHALEGRQPAYDVRPIAILRYWQELVVTEERLQTLQTTDVVEGDGSRL